MLRNLFDKKARMRRLARDGVEAKALLLNIHYDTDKSQLQMVRLQLQVYPETGRNFVSEISEVPDQLNVSEYRVGDYLNVKYNPLNTKEILIISANNDDL